MGNSYGHTFRLSTWGESHGAGIGVVVDGCPPRLPFTVDDIQRVTRTYLQPQRLSIVLVGDVSAFIDDLPGVGFDNVDVLSIDELDLSRADLRRSSAAHDAGPRGSRLVP